MKKGTLYRPYTAATTLVYVPKERFVAFGDRLELNFCGLHEPLLFTRSCKNVYPTFTYPPTNNNSF